MVRTADSARSSAAVMAPTASCACRDSRRTPRETLIATARPAPTAKTVTSRSETSTSAMATMAPTPTTTEPAISTTPEVTVARSSVVSAPTRDIRSPVRRRSYSAIGNHSSRSVSVRRVVRTTPSAVRWSRYCWAAPRAEAATRTTTRSSTGGSSGRPALTAPMTRATSTGWASAPAAATSDNPAGPTSGSRWGRSSGSRFLRPTRGGSGAACASLVLSGPVGSVAGGQRADDGGEQSGVVLDELRPVTVGPDRRHVTGRRPELVAVIGAHQQPLDRGVGAQAAHLRAVLGRQQLPSRVEGLVAAGDLLQAARPVLPEPGGAQAELRHGAQQRCRRHGPLRNEVPAAGVDDVEGHQLEGSTAPPQHARRAMVLGGPHRRGGHELLQDGVLGCAAVRHGPPVLQRPVLRTDEVALGGQSSPHLRAARTLPAPEQAGRATLRPRRRRWGWRVPGGIGTRRAWRRGCRQVP